MDMVADGFIGTLEKSLKEGKVTEADIDKACRRILEAKYKLGLFANPYKYCDVKRAEKEVFTPEHRSIARQIATETFVLLKNQDNLLPLQRKGNIALIGPLANTRANMPALGVWQPQQTNTAPCWKVSRILSAPRQHSLCTRQQPDVRCRLPDTRHDVRP